MQLVDVDVLIYAFREESQDHLRYRAWLEDLAMSGEAFSAPELVLCSFLRLVTDAHIFRPGTPWTIALSFVEMVRAQPGYVRLAPGPRHWEIFVRLCEEGRATGKLVQDAYLAAIAIEHGCEFVSADRHFARFPGVRLRHPLES
jgi:uncharacterized protein